MKRWFFRLTLVLLILLAFLYILIPGKINFKTTRVLRANPQACFRLLQQEANWKKWWPGNLKTENSNDLIIQGYSCRISPRSLNILELSMKKNSDSIAAYVNILPLGLDSAGIEWTVDMLTGTNPWGKISRYLESKKIRKQMDAVMNSMTSFLSNKDSVYSFHIEETKVKDTVLMSTRKNFTTYPSTQEIYSMIQSIRQFISSQGGVETGYPMLHVDHKDSAIFETMVAIPINHTLSENKIFVLKRMIPGKILFTEFSGGNYTAGQAMHQMNFFVLDFKRSSPAIPFYSLITNRIQEPDTTRWITRVYFPVY